jgi:hypothetical protein
MNYPDISGEIRRYRLRQWQRNHCQPCDSIIRQIDADNDEFVVAPLPEPVMVVGNHSQISDTERHWFMAMVYVGWIGGGLLLTSAMYPGWWQWAVMYLSCVGGFYHAILSDCEYLEADEVAV